LPEQTVATALNSLSEQTDIQVLFPYDIAAQLTSEPLLGRFSIELALERLLRDTGLHGGLTSSGVITISQTGSESTTNQNGKGKIMNSKNSTTRKTLLAGLVGLFAAGGATQVAAQGGEAATEQGRIDEIIVTAERRSASMQDVPISISAFSGDRLQQSGISDTLDLEMVTPGLSLSIDGNLGHIFIRGIGASSLQGPGSDPSAATYIDGVYQADFATSMVDFLDVERVEVLKGPQGTLYGRNSTGGAIKYISKRPGREFGGNLKAEVGDYNRVNLLASMDLPLIEDKLLMRAVVRKKKHDGYLQNIVDSSFDSHRDDVISGRFTLNYLPSDNVDVLLHATLINDDGDVTAYRPFLGPNPGASAGAQVIDDPHKVAADHGPSETPSRIRAVDANVSWNLGWATLTSITAYHDYSFGPFIQDIDGTELAIAHQARHAANGEEALDGIHGDSQTFTQEITLASAGQGKLDWTVGLFYFDGDTFQLSGLDFAVVSFFGLGRTSNETKAYAGFGDITYSLTDKLRLNAGIRYSNETKERLSRTEHIFTTGQVISEYTIQEGSWSDWSPKVGLDYAITDDVMVYFSASKGFKSGAIGSTVADPEHITAYEIGAKTMFWDDRLRLNASAFKYDYKDLQVLTFDVEAAVSLINNAAKANIQGAEIAATALLSESFQMDIGLSFLDAEYDTFLRQDPADPSVVIDLKGNKLSQAPEFTANVGFSYNHQVNGVGNLLARVDYYHSAKKYFNEFNDQGVQDSYELLNARISFETQDGDWNLSLFGKNLTDELVYQHTIISSFLFGDGLVAAVAPPRTYGVSVAYNF
jgi:iron complex outermembrane receptor protein